SASAGRTSKSPGSLSGAPDAPPGGSGAIVPRDALEPVATGAQRADLGVGDRALEHPEAAIRVNVAHAPGAQRLLGPLDRAGHVVGALDVGGLDVDHAQAEADPRIELGEGIQLVG